ncbi:MAG: CPBP family intramembrane metalloprotease, partial [Candidatus Omnitrophica bacterium]|nr:CPBP family intramembrane metalloprotease [Candidatus Omnitrophota bacterium]
MKMLFNKLFAWSKELNHKKRILSVGLASVVSGVLFSFVHSWNYTYFVPFYLFQHLISGITFALIYELSGSLFTVIGMHVLNNAFVAVYNFSPLTHYFLHYLLLFAALGVVIYLLLQTNRVTINLILAKILSAKTFSTEQFRENKINKFVAGPEAPIASTTSTQNGASSATNIQYSAKAGLINREGLPALELKVKKQGNTTSLEIGQVEVEIKAKITGAVEFTIFLERPLAEPIEDTWRRIAEFITKNNIEIEPAPSSKSQKMLGNIFEANLSAVEQSAIFERDADGVNYKMVNNLVEEFYQLIKSKVLVNHNPTTTQDKGIEKELKEIIEESVKNAFESIEIRFIREDETIYKDVPSEKRGKQTGEVKIVLIPENGNIIFRIIDNGVGVAQAISRLTETAVENREDINEWLGDWVNRWEAAGVQSSTKRAHQDKFSKLSGQGQGLMMIEHFSHDRLIQGAWTLKDRMNTWRDKNGGVFTYRFTVNKAVEKTNGGNGKSRTTSSSSAVNPYPQLNLEELTLKDLQQYGLFGKYEIRNLLRGGPIAQAEPFVVFAQDKNAIRSIRPRKGIVVNHSALENFSNPADVRDFDEVIREILSGKCALPVIYKPNFGRYGLGIFILSGKAHGKITITMAYGITSDDGRARDYLAQLNLKGIRYYPKNNISRVTLDTKTQPVASILHRLWVLTSSDIDGETYDSGMMEPYIPSFFKVNGKAYETRHELTGDLYSGNSEFVNGETYAREGSSKFFSNFEGRTGKVLGSEQFFEPLLKAHVSAQKREAFRQYVNNLFKAEFKYMSNRIKTAGIIVKEKVHGTFDLMWLIQPGAEFPVPVIIEASFLFKDVKSLDKPLRGVSASSSSASLEQWPSLNPASEILKELGAKSGQTLVSIGPGYRNLSSSHRWEDTAIALGLNVFVSELNGAAARQWLKAREELYSQKDRLTVSNNPFAKGSMKGNKTDFVVTMSVLSDPSFDDQDDLLVAIADAFKPGSYYIHGWYKERWNSFDVLDSNKTREEEEKAQKGLEKLKVFLAEKGYTLVEKMRGADSHYLRGMNHKIVIYQVMPLATASSASDLSRGGWVNIHPAIRNWSVRGLESESDVRTMNNEIFVEGGLRGLVRSMKDTQGSDITHFILFDDKGAMVAAYQVAERKENLLARTQAGLQQRVVASVSGNFAVHPDYSRRGLMRILDSEGKPVSIGSNFFSYAKDEWLRQGVGMLFGRSINEKGIKFWESVGGVTPMGSAISLEPSARVKKVDLEPQYSDLGKTYYRRIFDLKPYTSQAADESLMAALVDFSLNPQLDLFNNLAARVMYENLFRIEDLLWVLERFARIARSSGLSDDVIARLLARVIQTDQPLVEVLKLRKEEMGRYEIQPQQELADVIAKSLVAAQQGARGSSSSAQIKFPFEVLELARKENEIPDHEKDLIRMINLRNQRAKNNPEGTRGFIFIDPRFADVVLDKVLTPAHTRVASLERIYWEIAILYTLAARLLSRKDFKTVDGLVAFINRSDMYRLMDTIDASFKHTEVLAVAREVAVKRQHQDSLEGVDAFIRQELKANEKAGHHFVMEVRHNGETIPLDIITREVVKAKNTNGGLGRSENMRPLKSGEITSATLVRGFMRQDLSKILKAHSRKLAISNIVFRLQNSGQPAINLVAPAEVSVRSARDAQGNPRTTGEFLKEIMQLSRGRPLLYELDYGEYWRTAHAQSSFKPVYFRMTDNGEIEIETYPFSRAYLVGRVTTEGDIVLEAAPFIIGQIKYDLGNLYKFAGINPESRPQTTKAGFSPEEISQIGILRDFSLGGEEVRFGKSSSSADNRKNKIYDSHPVPARTRELMNALTNYQYMDDAAFLALKGLLMPDRNQENESRAGTKEKTSSSASNGVKHLLPSSRASRVLSPIKRIKVYVDDLSGTLINLRDRVDQHKYTLRAPGLIDFYNRRLKEGAIQIVNTGDRLEDAINWWVKRLDPKVRTRVVVLSTSSLRAHRFDEDGKPQAIFDTPDLVTKQQREHWQEFYDEWLSIIKSAAEIYFGRLKTTFGTGKTYIYEHGKVEDRDTAITICVMG